jgi:hypothetical protein
LSDERVDSRAERRAQAVLKLRALLANGDFDRYATAPLKLLAQIEIGPCGKPHPAVGRRHARDGVLAAPAAPTYRGASARRSLGRRTQRDRHPAQSVIHIDSQSKS